jgi:hypothetical protein
MTILVLNQHEAQWALSLSQFQFVITYHFGTNKGNMMRCPIAHTLCLRKEMMLMNNNVISLSNLDIFNFRRC